MAVPIRHVYHQHCGCPSLARYDAVSKAGAGALDFGFYSRSPCIDVSAPNEEQVPEGVQ